MRISDYSFIDPGEDTEAAEQFQRLESNHHWRAARLITLLEEFVAKDTNSAHRIIVKGQIEIYFIPPLYVLVRVSDAAALVRVDHGRKQVEIVQVIEEYGAGVHEVDDRDVLATPLDGVKDAVVRATDRVREGLG